MPAARNKAASAPKPTAARATGNRPAVVRMKRLFDLLKKGQFPNCQKLAKDIEVSAKTIQRDIDCMRDQLGFLIKHSAILRRLIASA